MLRSQESVEQTDGHDQGPADDDRGSGRDVALAFELGQAALEPGLEVVGPLAGLGGVEPGVFLARLFLGQQGSARWSQ